MRKSWKFLVVGLIDLVLGDEHEPMEDQEQNAMIYM